MSESDDDTDRESVALNNSESLGKVMMSKTILLVDDTQTVIMTERMMLSELGFTIHTAKNGVEALKLAATIKPDLVLLDIVMPEMDGIETCRRLKEDPTTRGIPVVMVTTKGEPDKVEEAFLAGCNDYITKPIDKLELVAKVKAHM